MKRKFADLNLRLPIHDLNETRNMLEKARELGYRLIATSLPADINEKTVEELRKLCGNFGVEFVFRVDLTPRNRKELLSSLGRLRRKTEIIGVVCFSKVVARQAAKDRRVDLLTFPSLAPRKRFFDPQEAELASNTSAALEICMEPILSLYGARRARLLSCLRKEAAIALKFGVPIVISSGVSEALLMRKPQELAALATLFDLDMPTALDAVSKVPYSLVKRNREKLKPSFIAPGIRLVRRGTDC